MSVVVLYHVVFLIGFVFLVAALILYSRGMHERKLKEAEEELRELRKFNHKFPDNTRFYYDRVTDKGCRRCTRGRIYWRFRYKIVSVNPDETTIKELTRIYWCSSCSFRGLSLR